MSYMLDEIHEQPEIVNRLVQIESPKVTSLAEEVRRRDINMAIIAARGTSDNAARYGKYLFEIVNGLPVALAAPSVFTLYESKLRMNNALVIGISQSGQAPDVVEYLKEAKAQGALTAAITNETGSSITEVADCTIFCQAEKERSVAATKTYTSTCAALYLFSAKLRNDQGQLDNLMSVAEKMNEVLGMEDYISSQVQRYRYMSECFVVARGINHATAFETALKLTETSYIAARPYSSADLMHGPIASLHQDTPCFLFAPDGKALNNMLETINKVKEKGAETIVIANDQRALEGADTALRMPEGIDELISPLVYIVAGQLFAYHLAMVKGHDPDRPRGLKKVTLTR